MTHAFIGLMVLYRLTADEAKVTNRRRDDTGRNLEKMREERPGFQAHAGNSLVEGDRVPMVVTWVGTIAVNGQAFLDGNDSLWIAFVEEGDEPGQWQAITDG